MDENKNEFIKGCDEALSIPYEQYIFTNINSDSRKTSIKNVITYTVFMSVLMILYACMTYTGIVLAIPTLFFWAQALVTDYKRAKHISKLRLCLCRGDYMWKMSGVNGVCKQRRSKRDRKVLMVQTPDGDCESLFGKVKCQPNDICIVVVLDGVQYAIPANIDGATGNVSMKKLTARNSNMSFSDSKVGRAYDFKTFPDNGVRYLREQLVSDAACRLKLGFVLIAIAFVAAAVLWTMSGLQALLLTDVFILKGEVLYKIAFMLRFVLQLVIPIVIFICGYKVCTSSYTKLHSFTTASTWVVDNYSSHENSDVVMGNIKAKMLLYCDHDKEYGTDSVWVVLQKNRKEKLYAFCVDSLLSP